MRSVVLSFRHSYRDKESINQLNNMKYEMFETFLKCINLALAFSALATAAQNMSSVSFICLLLARVLIFFAWCVFIAKLILPSSVNKENAGNNQFLFLSNKVLNDKCVLRLCGKIIGTTSMRSVTLGVLFASMFDMTTLRLLPWTRSEFTDRVQGYPNMFIVRCCLYSTFLSSFCQTVGSVYSIATTQKDVYQAVLFIVVSMCNTILSFLSVILFAQLAKTNLIKVSISLNDGRDEDKAKDIELQAVENPITAPTIAVVLPSNVQSVDAVESQLLPETTKKQPEKPKQYDLEADEEEDQTVDERGIVFNTKLKYADETVNILKGQLSSNGDSLIYPVPSIYFLYICFTGFNPLEYIPLKAIKAELEDLFSAVNNGEYTVL
jgi:hypothetical protein